jgi:hypothetical protein
MAPSKPAVRIFPLGGRPKPVEPEQPDDDEAPQAKVVRARKRRAPITTEARTP